MNGTLPDSPGKALMGLVLPAVQATDAAVKRALRQHASLVTIEALRVTTRPNMRVNFPNPSMTCDPCPHGPIPQRANLSRIVELIAIMPC